MSACLQWLSVLMVASLLFYTGRSVEDKSSEHGVPGHTGVEEHGLVGGRHDKGVKGTHGDLLFCGLFTPL